MGLISTIWTLPDRLWPTDDPGDAEPGQTRIVRTSQAQRLIRSGDWEFVGYAGRGGLFSIGPSQTVIRRVR